MDDIVVVMHTRVTWIHQLYKLTNREIKSGQIKYLLSQNLKAAIFVLVRMLNTDRYPEHSAVKVSDGQTNNPSESGLGRVSVWFHYFPIFPTFQVSGFSILPSTANEKYTTGQCRRRGKF